MVTNRRSISSPIVPVYTRDPRRITGHGFLERVYAGFFELNTLARIHADRVLNEEYWFVSEPDLSSLIITPVSRPPCSPRTLVY